MLLREDRGQATVELLALVPLLVIAALAAAAVLARAAAEERAGEAARAGAMALLQDENPRAAARGAIGAAERDAAHVAVDGRRVTVSLAAPAGLRGLVSLGRAEASADAGPEPRP
jgi:hypothetical protein